MQPFSDLRDIGHIGCGALDMTNQAGLDIGIDKPLYAKDTRVAFLDPAHRAIAHVVFVLRRTGIMHDRGIDESSLTQ